MCKKFPYLPKKDNVLIMAQLCLCVYLRDVRTERWTVWNVRHVTNIRINKNRKRERAGSNSTRENKPGDSEAFVVFCFGNPRREKNHGNNETTVSCKNEICAGDMLTGWMQSQKILHCVQFTSHLHKVWHLFGSTRIYFLIDSKKSIIVSWVPASFRRKPIFCKKHPVSQVHSASPPKTSTPTCSPPQEHQISYPDTCLWSSYYIR